MSANYVDGFVIPIPKKKFKEYKKMASDAAKAWIKFGALGYYECVGEDLNIKPQGGIRMRSFPQIAKAKKTDQVWFSFITYKSRAHRDSVNKKVMAYLDKKYASMKNITMPFDPKNAAYGGFKVIVRK